MTQLIQQPKQREREGSSRSRPIGKTLRRYAIRLIALSFVGVIGLLMGMAVWASVRATREADCRNNLQQLGVALQSYHDKHGHFPAATIAGGGGKPLLSWRVALLPDIGRKDLYEQFHLDEPWDSPHNLTLLSKMPDVYGCPSEPDRTRGMTTYQIAVGPKAGLGVVGTMFEETRGIDIREVTDGTSNTVLVAETGQPVPWTKPGDPRFAEDGPLPSFGSRHAQGFHVLFADGSVRRLNFMIAHNILRGLLTRDRGEVLSGSS